SVSGDIEGCAKDFNSLGCGCYKKSTWNGLRRGRYLKVSFAGPRHNPVFCARPTRLPHCAGGIEPYPGSICQGNLISAPYRGRKRHGACNTSRKIFLEVTIFDVRHRVAIQIGNSISYDDTTLGLV